MDFSSKVNLNTVLCESTRYGFLWYLLIKEAVSEILSNQSKLLEIEGISYKLDFILQILGKSSDSSSLNLPIKAGNCVWTK